MQVLGPDIYNGSAAQLDGFRTQTGATYPLLLNGGLGAGNEDLDSPATYGQWDNYVIINKQGVIRYHAYDYWPHGNRYHLDELRGTIDSLVTTVVGIDDRRPRAYSLEAAPNPFRERATLALMNPGPSGSHARVTVHDVAGRRVATLWD